MAEPLKVERRGGGARLEQQARGGLYLFLPDAAGVKIEADDLHWLVTTGGPAMIALLGGPIEGRGIERTDRRG